jgi:hypothetical protein
LAVVALEVASGLLHLDEHSRLPLQVGVGRPPVVVLFDAPLQGRASLAHALVAERLEQVLQEESGLALLVAGQVLVAIPHEALKALAHLSGDGIGRHRGAVSPIRRTDEVEEAAGSQQPQ